MQDTCGLISKMSDAHPIPESTRNMLQKIAATDVPERPRGDYEFWLRLMVRDAKQTLEK